jgi:hypothetical protein
MLEGEIDRIIANTIDQTARGDPEALAARIRPRYRRRRLPHRRERHRTRFAGLRRADARNAPAKPPWEWSGLEIQDRRAWR